MGDPAGIGPEITVKALQHQALWEKCIPVVVGEQYVLEDALAFSNLKQNVRSIRSPEEAAGEPGSIECISLQALAPKNYRLGQVSPFCGEAAFRYIVQAISYAMEGRVAGVVTAPINKEALHLAGHLFSGHTEIFAEYTHTPHYAMLLMSGNLRVIHCTTHVSMRKACDQITRERVGEVIGLADQAMRMMGLEHYTIGVAGLNAHCSENGLFGTEEAEAIAPAIRDAQARGLPVEGPVPPDTVFVKALAGQYDVVVAMYHDQGHIPLKVVGFRLDASTGKFTSLSGINTTIGLPILRTSVDHGTAFDKAGQNLANEASMVEAIQLAAQMAPYYQKKE